MEEWQHKLKQRLALTWMGIELNVEWISISDLHQEKTNTAGTLHSYAVEIMTNDQKHLRTQLDLDNRVTVRMTIPFLARFIEENARG